jgi:hypothetical protein
MPPDGCRDRRISNDEIGKEFNVHVEKNNPSVSPGGFYFEQLFMYAVIKRNVIAIVERESTFD